MRTASWKTPFILTAAIVATLGGAAPGAEPAPAEDVWEGKLDVGGGLRLVLRVAKAKDGALKAEIDSPDQGANGLKVDSVTLDKKALKFTMKGLRAEFSGKLDDAGTKAKGEWTQNGKSFPLTLEKSTFKPLEVWEGKLAAGAGISLRLVVRVAKSKDGELRATLASPDQGPGEFSVDSFTRDKGTLKFAIKKIRGEFSGKLNAEGTEAVGEWKQNGNALPLTLSKKDKVTETRRPQVPKPPFPYDAEQVTYENKDGGITLAGTLTRPKGAGPFPAVLLISGSGAQDRDESLLGHKPFLVLADHLTRRGVVVLRVDDRGVGESSGDPATATTEDFAGDVLAGVAFLKARKEVDPKKIGLIGHSEGGIIAPMVATRSGDVAFIVLMAGTGLPGDAILNMQAGLILKAMGVEEGSVAKKLQGQKRLIEVVKAEKDEKAAAARMRAIADELVKELPEAERADAAKVNALVESQLSQLRSPWFRYFLTFDPRPTLAKVRCPVLAINGEKDLQVPPKENLAEIEKAIKSGGNTRVTVKELPGLNHLFQTCKTGAPSEYAAIEETIAPAALTVMADWIAGQAGGADSR